MRILHLADLHLGRTVRSRGRMEEFRALADEIVEVVRSREVDLLIVAGDVYHTSSPGAEAEQVFYNLILRVNQLGVRVVVAGGNHDGRRRIEAIGPVLKLVGVYALGAPRSPEAGGVERITLRNGEEVRVGILPFLSQRGVVQARQLMDLKAEDQLGQYQVAYRRLVAKLAEAMDIDDGLPRLLVAHPMVQNATLDASERPVHVTPDYAVPVDVFPDDVLDYVALGHVHECQRIPHGCPVWYAGAPLDMEFRPGAVERGGLLVDIQERRNPEVTFVPLRAARRLVTFRGSLEELAEEAPDLQGAHVRVVLEGVDSRIGLADDVRELLPSAVDIAVAASPRTGGIRPEGEASTSEALSGDPLRLFSAYARDVGIEDEAVEATFSELLAEVQEAEGEGEDASVDSEAATASAGREA